MNNVTDEKHFTITVKGTPQQQKWGLEIFTFLIGWTTLLGMELERVGDPKDPLVGSNITLICRSIFPEVKYPAPPEWAYQINNAIGIQVISETDPPEGSSEHHLLPISIVNNEVANFFAYFHVILGFRIQTEGEKQKHNTSGFNLNYYESRLHLFNINKNTYTTYQCKANKYKDAVTKTISFRIKGKDGNVLLLRGRQFSFSLWM